MENRTLYSRDVLRTIYKESKSAVAPRDIILKEEDITGLAKIIEARPYGEIEATRYRESPNGLYLGWCVSIVWYTFHRKKYVKWDEPRNMPDVHVMERPSHGLHISEFYDKTESWKQVFPERYYAYVSHFLSAKLKKMGLATPPEGVYVSNILQRNYGMCLVSAWKSNNYLCSPIGVVEIEPYVQTIEGALKEVGIPLPKKYENRTWRKIEPRWVMATLKR